VGICVGRESAGGVAAGSGIVSEQSCAVRVSIRELKLDGQWGEKGGRRLKGMGGGGTLSYQRMHRDWRERLNIQRKKCVAEKGWKDFEDISGRALSTSEI